MRYDIGLLLLLFSIGAVVYGLFRWQDHRRRERIRIWGTHRRHR